VWPELGPVEDSTEHEEASGSTSRVRRYAVVTASLAVAAVLSWFGVRAFSRPSGGDAVPAAQTTPAQPVPRPQAVPGEVGPPRDAAPPAAAAPPAPAAAPAARPPASATTPSSAPAPPPTPASRASTSSPEPAGERFEIVVASFRTAIRATDVANAIAALPEPVRQRSAGGWQQVLAGPYASAEEARAAQQRLERAGFTGTHVTTAER